MRVLGFGTYDETRHPRVAILLDGLRAHGFEVSECNRPLGLDTAERVAILKGPWRLPLLLGRLLVRWAALGRASRQHRDAEIVLVGYLGLFDVLLARRLFPRATIVLDHLVGAAETALDRDARARPVLRALRWLDRRAIAAADLIVVDTDEHRSLVEEVDPARRDDVVVVNVGATRDWFEAGRAVAATEPPAGAEQRTLRVVFFGLYTPLQGTTHIGAALAELERRGANVQATMVGTGQAYAATRQAAGDAAATWTSWVPAAELPAFVAGHDVCLGIFGTEPKALRVVPNKVYQGIAAGCVVVTSDTTPQRRIVSEVAVLVPPGDAGALADALERLAADRAEVQRRRRDAVLFAAATLTPDVVTAELAETLRRVR